MMEWLLERHLDEKVRFTTAWNTELTGEVTVLADGSIGIVTPREVYEPRDVRKIMMVFNE